MLASVQWRVSRNSCFVFFCNVLCNFSGSGVSHFKPSCQICCITTLKRIFTGDAIPIGSKFDATRLNSFLWLYIAAFFGNSSNGIMKTYHQRNSIFVLERELNLLARLSFHMEFVPALRDN